MLQNKWAKLKWSQLGRKTGPYREDLYNYNKKCA